MNLSQCLRLAACALFAAFLGGCGSSSSSTQTAPVTEGNFYSSSAIFRNHSTGMVMAGYNAFGQLATGNFDNQATFQQPAGLSIHVSGFSVGGVHTLVFQNNSTVQAWGSNHFGQLGNPGTGIGNSAASKNPVTVTKADGSVLSRVTGVAAGGDHSLAISGGQVWAWGGNDFGQLGVGDTTDRSSAVQVILSTDNTPLSNIDKVAAGGSFSLALDSSSGVVYSWGSNTNGQLSNGNAVGTNASKANPVTGLPAGKKVIDIAAGGSYAVVLLDDNTVYAWGYDFWGQIGIDPRDPSKASLLAKDAQGNTITAIEHPRQIFKDINQTVPLLATKIAAGFDHVLALEKGSNTVWAWGQDFFGQLGDNNRSVKATPGPEGTTLFFSITPVQMVTSQTAGGGAGVVVPGVTEIYAYGNSSFAMTAGNPGTLYVWGANQFGQLGFSDTTKLGYQENPTQVTVP